MSSAAVGENRAGIGTIITYALLFIGALLSLFPFYWMFVSSLKQMGDIFTYPPILFTMKLSLDNFRQLFAEYDFMRNVFNSGVVSVGFTAISMFICTLAGFGFGKYKFPGKDFLFYFLLATMMIPIETTVIPLYMIMIKFGWLNTYPALMAPGLAYGFGVFWIKQYVENVPDDLLDAARIDGCTEFMIYYRIILPVIRPALAALAIFLFMRTWNDFLWPLIVIRTEEMYTIPLALSSFLGLLRIPYDLIMAGSALATAPLIIVFLLLQRQFISGILAGTVKG